MKHKISFNKVINPATYKQIEYLRSFNNVTIDNITNSQLLKRLDFLDASNLIDSAKDNENIEITR